MEHAQRVGLGLTLQDIEGAVNDRFGYGLLAVQHDGIHELGDNEIAELRVRVDLALFCSMATGHTFRLSSKGSDQRNGAGYCIISDASRRTWSGAACGS